jgi:AcrR family transcriptional regulator
MAPAQKADRRIRRTHGLLHDALNALVHEKPYGAISVKEILARANVGRSTFYMHFGDKDELLVSGMQDMLRAARASQPKAVLQGPERIIWFSLPIFEHIHQHRRASVTGTRRGSAGRGTMHEHLRSVLVDLIAAEIDDEADCAGDARMSRYLLIRYVASTFVLVLDWWIDRRSPLGPAEIHGQFKALVLPTLLELA